MYCVCHWSQLPVTIALLTDHQREYSDDSWTGPGPVAERRRQEEMEAQQLKEKEEQLRAMEVNNFPQFFLARNISNCISDICKHLAYLHCCLSFSIR